MLSVPMYRARKIDSNEYVIGNLISKLSLVYIAIEDTIDSNNAYDLLTFSDENTIFEIDPLTLAIHFDKNANDRKTKVFFSLSEDGNGGDVVEYQRNKYVAKWNPKSNKLEFVEIGHDYNVLNTMADVKVTGIQD